MTMKKRKKLKEFYNKHKDEILFVIVLILAIALFIGGFLVFWKKPMSDSQFEICEQIARDVYEQKGQVIVEVPEDFSVSMTATTITVIPPEEFGRGKVDAYMYNGELVVKRSLETGSTVTQSIAMGIVFFCFGALTAWIGYGIRKIVKAKKENK